jgi:hypothetical protein
VGLQACCLASSGASALPKYEPSTKTKTPEAGVFATILAAD